MTGHVDLVLEKMSEYELEQKNPSLFDVVLDFLWSELDDY